MKKLIVIPWMLLCHYAVQSQSIVVDGQSQEVDRAEFTNTAAAIGSKGFLTLARVNKGERKYMAYAGADFGNGQYKEVIPDKKFEPFGKLSTDTYGYIYMLKGSNYICIGAGEDFAINLRVNALPKGFRPLGLVPFANKGLFFNANSLVLHDPVTLLNEQIPIIPEVLKSQSRIVDIDTFEGSDEIVIYLGSTSDITHLVRYTMGSKKSMVLALPKSRMGYPDEGRAAIAGAKTYFCGTLKNTKIKALTFVAFEALEMTSVTNLPVDSLSFHKQYRAKTPEMNAYDKQRLRLQAPVESVSYTPIVLDDGDILVVQELFMKKTYDRQHMPEKNEITGVYDDGKTTIFMGYECYTGTVVKYGEQGEVKWEEYFGNFAPNPVNLRMESLSRIAVLDSNMIRVVQPNYQGIEVCLINPDREFLSVKGYDILPVDAENYPRERKNSFRTNSKRLLPVGDENFLFYGYDIVKPLIEERKLMERASFQLLDLRLAD